MDSPQKGNNTSVRKSSTLSNQFSPGKALNSFSDLVNDNLILFRYGTTATVAFLTVYGLSQTPLFFRFKKVADIPSSYFMRRKTLYGRIVHVVENDLISKACQESNEKPIICLIRQTSPFERILNRSSVEFFMRNNPSSHLKSNSRLEDAKDLLKVELAGIKEPPVHFDPNVEDTNQWLKSLARERTPVSCTLLSRRIIDDSTTSKLMHDEPIDAELEETAICQLKYRPPGAFFGKDIGSKLVEEGKAEVAPGIHIDLPPMTTIDGSTKIRDMQADVNYLELLASFEMDAIKQRNGIWSIARIREERPDLVNEAEFELQAGILQKLWRRFTQ